jgi:hypothetical protein
VALKDLSAEAAAQPFGPNNLVYGGARTRETWDEDKTFACVCDSAWDVGYGDGEVQEPTWFGPDCSLQHCPSGDDPFTADVDETNCFLFDHNRDSWRGPTDALGAPLFEAQDGASFAAVLATYLAAWNEWPTVKNAPLPDSAAAGGDGDGVVWPRENNSTHDDLDVVQPGTTGSNIGVKGNLCHVDCSRRGLCNHATGLCRCFAGHYGDDCGLVSALARGL